MSKPKGPTHAAYFHLVDDGGWLTTAGLAMAAGYLNENHLERNLYRWRKEGYVEGRQIGLASSRKAEHRPGGPWARTFQSPLGRVEVRVEWRAA